MHQFRLRAVLRAVCYVLLYPAMACPYFYPTARFETSPWSVPPRLPLGDGFSGECRAPDARVQPGEAQMREVCNVGYGRHGCEQFPASAPADAIRFHVVKDAGKLIQIQFVFEKECWPGECGNLDYRVESGFAPCKVDEMILRQAGAFVESYLRRRNEA